MLRFDTYLLRLHKIFLPIVLAFISLVPQSFAAKVENEGAKPSIRFEEATFDFGLMPPGRATILQHDFKFTNTGSQKRKILSVGHACRTGGNCPKPDLSPGKSSCIRLHCILPADYTTSENFQREVEVKTDDPSLPSVQLTIKAKFSWSLKWEPSNVDFGNLSSSQPTTATITIRSNSNSKFHITKAEANNSIVDIETKNSVANSCDDVEKTKESGKDKKIPPFSIISLQIRPDAPVGFFSSALTLYTDRKDIPVIQIPISGTIVQGISAEPKEVFLGLVRRPQIIEKEIIISTNNPAFRIKQVTTDVSGLSCKLEKISSGYRNRLTLNSSKASNLIEGCVVITTNDPSTPIFKVNVTGIIKDAKTGMSDLK